MNGGSSTVRHLRVIGFSVINSLEPSTYAPYYKSGEALQINLVYGTLLH